MHRATLASGAAGFATRQFCQHAQYGNVHEVCPAVHSVRWDDWITRSHRCLDADCARFLWYMICVSLICRLNKKVILRWKTLLILLFLIKIIYVILVFKAPVLGLYQVGVTGPGPDLYLIHFITTISFVTELAQSKCPSLERLEA